MLHTRPLGRHEIERIWSIDRGELIERVYRLRSGALVLEPAPFDLRGWPADQVASDTPALYACFDRGGAFVGAFAGDALAGVAVIDTLPPASYPDHLVLKYLYVGRPQRGLGVGRLLLAEARETARARGASGLYISATPTERTVDFYLRQGAVLAPAPDPALHALEPEDIHLLCPV